MNENEWTKSICKLLQNKLGDNIYIDVFRKIPYALEYLEFDENIKGVKTNIQEFETDLLIYEKFENNIKPRVIIESKIQSVTTHDAITYSYKAQCHKNVIPYLRYGIMLGNRGEYPLPGRLFRHGTNFDFLINFKGYELSNNEKESFIAMLKREIDYSRKFEEILKNSRKKDRKHYFMLQKDFHLE